MPWVALAVAVIAAGAQIYQSVEASNAQKQAVQAQQRMNDLRAARERTQQVREGNAKSAAVRQRAADEDASQSSSAITGGSDVLQEAYGNIQYVGFEQQAGDQISRARQQEADAQGGAGVAAGVGQIAGVFASPDNQKELGSIWDSIIK